MQFQGKVALVTGGARGLGKVIALAFAQEGADVVISSRNKKALGETTTEIERLGRESLGVITDFLEPGAPDVLVKKSMDKFGRVDILINNSGAEGPINNVTDMDLRGWNDLLAVNLNGAMLCSRNTLKMSMIPRKSGAIVNITSIAGRRGMPTRSAYSSSKFAMIALTQSLASEAGRYNIRVNAIAPGAIEGKRIERVFDIAAKNHGVTRAQIMAASNAHSALGRMVKPEEVADLAVFLASDKSSAITGQTINIDCGSNFN
jgi:meso-butanediol dehydrogenase/(S,S)-butanediol dehydrogenase/diacetyl reductase